jgi:hypothetical protein
VVGGYNIFMGLGRKWAWNQHFGTVSEIGNGYLGSDICMDGLEHKWICHYSFDIPSKHNYF